MRHVQAFGWGYATSALINFHGLCSLLKDIHTTLALLTTHEICSILQQELWQDQRSFWKPFINIPANLSHSITLHVCNTDMYMYMCNFSLIYLTLRHLHAAIAINLRNISTWSASVISFHFLRFFISCIHRSHFWLFQLLNISPGAATMISGHLYAQTSLIFSACDKPIFLNNCMVLLKCPTNWAAEIIAYMYIRGDCST